ncbi:hypothetical protein DYQ86_19840 [Acidobacteria bacterium AB60]|nr:hypothetical protein DYQ86_19840 [Acidobacteria bacterium AB60]
MRDSSVTQIKVLQPADLLPGTFVCPGGFPTDLTNYDCRYTERMRVRQWIATSVTDEAMLQSIASATFFGQTVPSPSEWARTWENYGRRIGANYTGATARGTTEFVVGNLMRDDPRHIRYKDDPRTHYGTKLRGCSEGDLKLVTYAPPGKMALRRVGHAFLDSVTVRHSSPCGNGIVLPAFDRMAGIWASAYASSGWYPAVENTLPKVASRAGTSFAITLGGSFYNEFAEELIAGATRLFGRGKGTN